MTIKFVRVIDRLTPMTYIHILVTKFSKMANFASSLSFHSSTKAPLNVKHERNVSSMQYSLLYFKRVPKKILKFTSEFCVFQRSIRYVTYTSLGRHNFDVGATQLRCWGDITSMGRHNLGRQGNGATQPTFF